jgi:RNA-splicing ligase RtcB
LLHDGPDLEKKTRKMKEELAAKEAAWQAVNNIQLFGNAPSDVADIIEKTGITKKVARLKPIGVIKG